MGGGQRLGVLLAGGRKHETMEREVGDLLERGDGRGKRRDKSELGQTEGVTEQQHADERHARFDHSEEQQLVALVQMPQQQSVSLLNSCGGHDVGRAPIGAPENVNCRSRKAWSADYRLCAHDATNIPATAANDFASRLTRQLSCRNVLDRREDRQGMPTRRNSVAPDATRGDRGARSERGYSPTQVLGVGNGRIERHKAGFAVTNRCTLSLLFDGAFSRAYRVRSEIRLNV